ncbi:TIGR04255 family protein [Plastoroseomonas hellenica]|uniref:TIGR04255 family protein n=1 Tax=Plastoroseomonas hellenica TaxID=2687306 RepID=UPI001BA480CF|nr:TIGR04255 family protein [Plastoroseomonas hellenica]MBR0647127.1 TIGR04255 family protein [Plastoroseomonas hellenica]
MPYRFAPITEAVFDLQFESPLSEADMRGAGREFQAAYPKAEDELEVRLEMRLAPQGLAPEIKPVATLSGLKLTGTSGDQLVVIKLKEFSSNKLAPYQSWEDFEPVCWDNYMTLKKKVGYRKITRMALRYINRIDVPSLQVGTANYINFGLSAPFESDSSSFSSTVACFHEGFVANLNIARLPVSPLFRHTSFLLDIDIWLSDNVPQKDGELREAFGRLRTSKNSLFESLITDQSRALFEVP